MACLVIFFFFLVFFDEAALHWGVWICDGWPNLSVIPLSPKPPTSLGFRSVLRFSFTNHNKWPPCLFSSHSFWVQGRRDKPHQGFRKFYRHALKDFLHLFFRLGRNTVKAWTPSAAWLRFSRPRRKRSRITFCFRNEGCLGDGSLWCRYFWPLCWTNCFQLLKAFGNPWVATKVVRKRQIRN